MPTPRPLDGWLRVIETLEFAANSPVLSREGRAGPYRKFEDGYAAYRQRVCASDPRFSRFSGPDFDRKIRAFKASAFGTRNGILNVDVEDILGCPLGVFLDYLRHFRVEPGHGLIYTGGGDFNVFPFVPNKLLAVAQ